MLHNWVPTGQLTLAVLVFTTIFTRINVEEIKIFFFAPNGALILGRRLFKAAFISKFDATMNVFLLS